MTSHSPCKSKIMMNVARVMQNKTLLTVRSIDCLVLEISLLPNCHACTPRQDRCRPNVEYCRGEGHDGWEVDRRVVTLLEHII